MTHENTSFDFAFLVIIYNCSISESATLNSLKDRLGDQCSHNKIKLVIWNNGPALYNKSEIAFFKKNTPYLVELTETTENIPLSKIYNAFIKQNHAKKYILLDHDSTINEDYIPAISKDNFDVLVPHIICQGNLEGPFFNKAVLTKDILTTSRSLTAIGSGLCLTPHLIRRLENKFSSVFDERFALYGVDTTLFYRIQSLDYSIAVNFACSGSLNHSLSRIEKEDMKTQKMRGRERSYDLALTLRHYPRVDVIKLFLATIIKRITGKNHYSLAIIISCYFRGKHPRSN